MIFPTHVGMKARGSCLNSGIASPSGDLPSGDKTGPDMENADNSSNTSFPIHASK